MKSGCSGWHPNPAEQSREGGLHRLGEDTHVGKECDVQETHPSKGDAPSPPSARCSETSAPGGFGDSQRWEPLEYFRGSFTPSAHPTRRSWQTKHTPRFTRHRLQTKIDPVVRVKPRGLRIFQNSLLGALCHFLSPRPAPGEGQAPPFLESLGCAWTPLLPGRSGARE